jgi:hypothetical protein
MHTPAPWVIFADRGHSIAVMPAMRRGEICSFEGARFPPAETDANARLIASAPELLDALVRLAANLGNPAGINRDTVVADHAAALEAIAKTTGEQP